MSDRTVSTVQGFTEMIRLVGTNNPTTELRDWIIRSEILVENLETAEPRARLAQEAALQKYLSLRGEQEANFVGDNAEKTLDQLPLTPLNSARYQTPDGQVRVSKKVGDIKQSVSTPLAIDTSLFPAAAERMFGQSKKGPVRKVVTGLLDYTGGLGKELNAMRENADGTAALHSHRAMNAYANVEQQFKNLAKRGVKEGKYNSISEGRKIIRKYVEEKLDAIKKLPTSARRESALASMVRENPYMSPIVRAYSQIDQLTKTLVSQELEASPNPTPEVLKRLTTMVNNSFGYTTRMYAAFQGEEGRSHSRKMVEERDAGMEALAKGKEVPAKYRESMRIYNNALDFIIRNDLVIPEGDAMFELSSEQLSNLYDTWVGNSARAKSLAIEEGRSQGMSQAVAREYADEVFRVALEERAAPVKAEYESKAKDIINGMLGIEDSNSPFATYYRGFRQDRSILEKRDRVPDEIKELFGEITDPAVRLSVTIAKQGELVARTRLLLDMKAQGEGKWVISPQDAGLPGNEQFSASLDGDTYGPLAGWRTTPAIATAIGENLEMFSSLSDSVARGYLNASQSGKAFIGSATTGVQKLAGAQKMLSIVAEPFGIIMNALGSPLMLVANGVTDITVIRDALRTGGQSVVDTMFTGRGELSPDLEDAISYGILDSARVQEIRRSPQRFVKKLITTKPEVVQGAIGGAKAAINTGVEMFAMSDAWVKVASFKDRVKVLQKYYGDTKTLEQIKQEAADTIKDTNITYGRTMPGVRMIESLGITTFLPYFVSVPRSLAYNNVVAYKDFVRAFQAPTAAGKMAMGMAAVKRLAGTQLATAGVVYGMKALAAAINDDDEDMEEAKKVMRPDARFSDSIYLGKDSKGNPLFFRMSRVDPYGPVNDMFRMLIDDSVTEEQAAKFAGQSAIDLLFTNRIVSSGVSMVANLLTDEQIKDNETKLERIAPKSTQLAKDAMLALGADYSSANSVLKTLDTLTPGWFDAIDPNNPKLSDPKNGWTEVLGNFVRWSGGRLDKADPGSYAFEVGKGINDAKKDGRKRIAESLRAGYSNEQMIRVVNESDQKLFEARERAIDLYEGMTNGLDMSPGQAKALLKDSGSMTEVDIAAVVRGRNGGDEHPVGVISKKSLDTRTKDRERKLSDEEMKQELEQNRQFIQNMRALGYKIGE